jgi:peroxiredoxin
VGEVPLLTELLAQHKDQDIVVVGISLDEELKPVQEMVTVKGISWPQVWDADKAIRKLYNVKGTPTYYLVDKQGRIAGKNLPSFKRLSGAIEDLLKKQ